MANESFCASDFATLAHEVYSDQPSSSRPSLLISHLDGLDLAFKEHFRSEEAPLLYGDPANDYLALSEPTNLSFTLRFYLFLCGVSMRVLAVRPAVRPR